MSARSLEKTPKTLYEGHVEPGWEKVKEVFVKNVESGQEKGGAFSVYHEGRKVVDLWGGYMDLDAQVPWREDTLCIVFSCTKGMCAICIATLVEKGLLDYKEPVAKYWPEFAQNGKENVTLETLLSHQAGLVLMDSGLPIQLTLEDPVELGNILARQKPNWEPGTAHGYHILSIGLYVDQIIRRVDPQKRDLQQYFREEIAEAFDIDYFIGLPPEENIRCVRLKQAQFGAGHFFKTKLPTLAWMAGLWTKSQFTGHNLSKKIEGNIEGWTNMNNPEFRKYPIGSSHGFTTARSLARVYGILSNGGADLDGKRLLKPETIQLLNEPLCSGPDKLLMRDMSFSRAMIVFPQEEKTNPPKRNVFGHAGVGGQLGAADPYYKLGWGYCTNYTNPIALFSVDHRYQALQDAMQECVRALHTKAAM